MNSLNWRSGFCPTVKRFVKAAAKAEKNNSTEITTSGRSVLIRM
jgi:hypothetical protein